MANWLRRLWPGGGSERTASISRGSPINGRAAALEMELRLSDSLLAVAGTPLAAMLREKTGEAHRHTARLLTPDGGASGCVETALGMAMSGQRVASFLGAASLSSIAPSLASAARRLTPMLTHAWLDGHAREGGHAQLHRLEGCGALLAIAATPQEAADLTLAVRLAAESTLCPAVLAVEGLDEEALALPDWAAVNAALGRAGDSIRCPTPSQVDVFGRDRHRVPRWIDPVHPLAMGMPASEVDTGMIAAGRSALFGEDMTRLVRASLAQARDLLGRPMSLIRRHRMDDAEIVLVAQGAVVPMAEDLAGELRNSFGWRVGVAGITWISPFPVADLAADLGGRRAVIVIEKTNASAGDEPPLVRRVRAAVRDKGIPVVSAISAGAPIRAETLMTACVSNLKRLAERKAKDQTHPGLDHRVRLDIPLSEEPSAFPRRAAIEARVRGNHPDLVAQIQSASRSLIGSDAGKEPTAVDPLPPEAPNEKHTPGLLRRISRARIAPDSLPRVWGEVLEPREKGPWPRLPDPIVASGAIPALSSALLSRAGDGPLPQVRLEGCTGCGRCWTACPEGAIGVTVTGLSALLDAAAGLANTKGPAAEAIKRAHGHIARRAAGKMDPDTLGILPRSLLQDAWIWASGKLDISEEALPQHDAAFQATLDRVEELRPIVTLRFFHRLVDEARAAELLILAIDPDTCAGCGLCAAECPETVVDLSCRSEIAATAAEHFAAWENLEDTSGATCARAASDPNFGQMAARLLSRHSARAMVGTGVVPGSGERLCLRLTTAMAEHHGQRWAASLERKIEGLRSELDEALRRRLSANLVDAEIQQLTGALQARGVTDMVTFAEALNRLGERTALDRRSMLELAELAMRLGDHRAEIVTGADGLGRSRYVMAVAGSALAERIAPYPHHPFFAPLVVDSSISGGSMAIGLAEALTQRHLELVSDLRRTAIEIEAPSDRPGRIEALARLEWMDLSPDERAPCPPLLFVIDETFLAENGAAFFSRLLTTDLPIKVVLLDGLQPERRPDSDLLAIAHQRAFVLASSIGDTDHMALGIEAALAHFGPAFIHLHAPAPDIHGFAPNATLERARAAIAARAHVLLRYDPAVEGAFGLRLSLLGNPSPKSEEPTLSLVDWAAGESRFGKAGETLNRDAAAAVSERWRTLEELSGTGGLLQSRIESKVSRRLAAENEAVIEARTAELEARIAEAVARAHEEARERLTDRLVSLTLAGRGATAAVGQEAEEGPDTPLGEREAS